MTGHLLRDIVALLALGAILAWAIVRGRRWRHDHGLHGLPPEAELQRVRADRREVH